MVTPTPAAHRHVLFCRKYATPSDGCPFVNGPFRPGNILQSTLAIAVMTRFLPITTTPLACAPQGPALQERAGLRRRAGPGAHHHRPHDVPRQGHEPLSAHRGASHRRPGWYTRTGTAGWCVCVMLAASSSVCRGQRSGRPCTRAHACVRVQRRPSAHHGVHPMAKALAPRASACLSLSAAACTTTNYHLECPKHQTPLHLPTGAVLSAAVGRQRSGGVPRPGAGGAGGGRQHGRGGAQGTVSQDGGHTLRVSTLYLLALRCVVLVLPLRRYAACGCGDGGGGRRPLARVLGHAAEIVHQQVSPCAAQISIHACAGSLFCGRRGDATGTSG